MERRDETNFNKTKSLSQDRNSFKQRFVSKNQIQGEKGHTKH